MSNPNVETVNEASGKWMLALALLLVVGGLAGFHALSAHGAVVRGGVLAAGLLAGLVVALISEPGRRFMAFGREAWRETRKVVWPTRKEAGQTTGIVFGFVLIMAAFLWSADKLIEWVVFSLILGWK